MSQRKRRRSTARIHRSSSRTALAREVATAEPRHRVRAQLRAARLLRAV